MRFRSHVAAAAAVVEPAAEAVPSLIDQVLAERPAIYCCVVARVRQQDARDLCQDVASTALQRLSTFDAQKGDLRKWLYGIVHNLILQHKQRCRRPCAARGDIFHWPDSSPNAEKRMVCRELFQELTEKIHPSRREIFLKRRIDGLTFEEIAELDHISPDTVRKRDARALEEFQAAWRAHQAEQRRLGAVVLPMSAVAFLAAIRACFSQVPDGLVESIRAAIDPRVHGEDAPASQTRPVSRQRAADPVEALVPDSSPASWQPWMGVFSTLVCSAIAAIVLLALLPGDKPRFLMRALGFEISRASMMDSAGAGFAPASPAVLDGEQSAVPPAGKASTSAHAAGKATSSAHAAGKATSSAHAAWDAQNAAVPSHRNAAAATTPARAARRAAARQAAAAATSAREARRTQPERQAGPMAHAALLAVQRAVDGGDIDAARAKLAIYDARYPHDPSRAARAKLASRIAAAH